MVRSKVISLCATQTFASMHCHYLVSTVDGVEYFTPDDASPITKIDVWSLEVTWIAHEKKGNEHEGLVNDVMSVF